MASQRPGSTRGGRESHSEPERSLQIRSVSRGREATLEAQHMHNLEAKPHKTLSQTLLELLDLTP